MLSICAVGAAFLSSLAVDAAGAGHETWVLTLVDVVALAVCLRGAVKVFIHNTGCCVPQIGRVQPK